MLSLVSRPLPDFLHGCKVYIGKMKDEQTAEKIDEQANRKTEQSTILWILQIMIQKCH